jgi:exonuclease SbcD
MRIIHIADTHLGLSAFHALDADGMNLRERLLYDHFLSAIDQIIAQRPDVLVHAGDLFDHVRPKNRSFVTVLEALNRLQDAGIPVVAIAGNHSMGKTRYTTSPFAILEYHGAEFHAAYKYRYSHVELGGAIFHLIPNMLRAEDYRKAFDEMTPAPGAENVLVTHGLATALSDRRLRTVAEHEIDSTMLSGELDYIALGHYHGQQQVGEQAWYSGSLEFLGYGEIHDTKGGLLIDLDRHLVEHLDLPCTPMIDAGTIDCGELTAPEISGVLCSLLEEATIPDQTMVQVTLSDLPRDRAKEIDFRSLNHIRERLLDLKVRILAREEDIPVNVPQDLAGIDYRKEFQSFVRQKGFTETETRYVTSIGDEVLQEVIQREGTDAP